MKARLRPILLGALLFLSGGVVALLVQQLVVRQEPSDSRLAHHTVTVAQIDSALQLTPAQRDSISAIFERHQSDIDSAWQSINRQLATAMSTVHHEVEAVLEPHQVAAFREWIHRQRRLHGAQH